MAFVHLDVRHFCILLICTAFVSVPSNAEIKVNPPEDFEIVDSGYLGYLSLQWQPPLFLDNFNDCPIEYELKYRNIGSKYWKTVITKNLHYKDGFDLNKGVEAKIHTLVPAQCTNGLEVRSSWSEATYWTSPRGNEDTKVREMDCVYYNWQHLLCTWKPGMSAHLVTNYQLFYWFEGLKHAIQCPDYIKANGKNTGCRFPHLESSDYKDFYICVNGSSESHPIQPSYFIFQLQNIVKPLPPEYLSLTVENSEKVNLRWSMPKGPIPAKCFIYEIEFTEDDTTWVVRTLHLFGKNTTTVENEIQITRTSNESKKLCFLVRSKINMYCSDDGLWSEWSDEQCWKGDIWKETVVFFLIPFAFISLFVLVITCLLLYNQRALLKTIFHTKKEVFSHQETFF